MLASCLAPITIAERAPVTIATGDPSAIYYPVGNAICRMVNLAAADDPAKHCQAVVPDGAVANVGKIRSGEATLGLTQSDLAHGAFRGEGPFAATGPDRELRTIIASHLRSFADLRGKRVGIGRSGAGYTFARDVVLGLYGWKISDFDHALELGPTSRNETLCDNDVDAIVLEARIPMA